MLLVKILTFVGFEVREAVDGSEAVANWESWQPHLIFMDMRMPVMDGYEATRIIKAKQIGYKAANTLRRLPKSEQMLSSGSQYLASGFPDSGESEVLVVPLFKSQLGAASLTPEATSVMENDANGAAKRSPTALAPPDDFSGAEQSCSNTNTIIIALIPILYEVA
ncbi:CheY chemotaxis protein or a CheY-like REC [Nostoc flagelliforme CCNUN1]|uniref:CheY chemotaxis protein or a CheY-like REC n=1 Tax=Nostoc flagelliforme CCNUN1 TaxID=2038116 RepID=A0A2K8T4Z2_9NOSO|nr:CheY chemotaxis protein or a CheY-like REC [Nostoc flagelliforme CCNUN1]